jgi:hypothetical protein
MTDDLGDLSVPGFEPTLRGAENAGAVVRAILADLGQRWGMPPEDFGRVIAADVTRALEESPVLLARLSAAIGAHLWRCFRGAAVLERLAEVGVRVRLDGAVLRARGRVTPDVARTIKDNRRELVAALRETG